MASDGKFVFISGRINMVRDSWKRRSIVSWNSLPASLRIETEALTFKKELREYVVNNIKQRL